MSSSNVRGKVGLYKRKITAIWLSAIVTTVVQTSPLVPKYQTDAMSTEYEEVIEKNTISSSFKNFVETQVISPMYSIKENIQLMDVLTTETAITGTTATGTTTTAKTTTTVATTTTTTSSSATTTTSTTTETTTTTVQTTTAQETCLAEAIPVVEVSDIDLVVDDEENVPEENVVSSGITVSDSDYILLCNAVGHEYGSDWVSVYEKALVVEVIMNRVNSPSYPNTIYDVLAQPYQFSGASGYLYLGTYSYQVTDSVKEAVNYYLNNPELFQEGYISFSGDGYRNYFR